MADRRRKRSDIPHRLKAGQRLVIEAESRTLIRVKGPRKLKVRIETEVDNSGSIGKN